MTTVIKRAYTFFILSVLCVFCVLGTGFALWSFDTQSETTQNMGVRVTQSTVLGTFYVPDIKFIVLDGGTGAGINPTITGVSFYKGDSNNRVVTDNSFEISFIVNDANIQQINENGNWENVCFGIRIAVPAELDGLVSHTDFYNEHIGENGYIDLKALTIELTDHFSDSDYSNSDFNYDGDTGTFTFALTTTTLNRFFTYSASNEPTTLDKYDKLGGNFAPCFIIELWQGYAETA